MKSCFDLNLIPTMPYVNIVQFKSIFTGRKIKKINEPRLN